MNRITNPILNGALGNLAVSQAPNRTGRIISQLIIFAFIVGSMTFVIMFLTGGVAYISSGGDKEAVQKATKRITTAIIGLVILFALYAILRLVSILFSVNLINLPVPTLNGT
jgi:hypothetical protein